MCVALGILANGRGRPCPKVHSRLKGRGHAKPINGATIAIARIGPGSSIENPLCHTLATVVLEPDLLKSVG